MTRMAIRTAVLSMLIFASTAEAGQLPADMWGGTNEHGGSPSITVGPNGVSVVLPESAIVKAGGGAVTDLAKQLLERYGPGLCSDVFDFQLGAQNPDGGRGSPVPGLCRAWRQSIRGRQGNLGDLRLYAKPQGDMCFAGAAAFISGRPTRIGRQRQPHRQPRGLAFRRQIESERMALVVDPGMRPTARVSIA